MQFTGFDKVASNSYGFSVPGEAPPPPAPPKPGLFDTIKNVAGGVGNAAVNIGKGVVSGVVNAVEHPITTITNLFGNVDRAVLKTVYGTSSGWNPYSNSQLQSYIDDPGQEQNIREAAKQALNARANPGAVASTVGFVQDITAGGIEASQYIPVGAAVNGISKAGLFLAKGGSMALTGAASNIMDDISNGRQIDWKRAINTAVTNAVFTNYANAIGPWKTIFKVPANVVGGGVIGGVSGYVGAKAGGATDEEAQKQAGESAGQMAGFGAAFSAAEHLRSTFRPPLIDSIKTSGITDPVALKDVENNARKSPVFSSSVEKSLTYIGEKLGVKSEGEVPMRAGEVAWNKATPAIKGALKEEVDFLVREPGKSESQKFQEAVAKAIQDPAILQKVPALRAHIDSVFGILSPSAAPLEAAGRLSKPTAKEAAQMKARDHVDLLVYQGDFDTALSHLKDLDPAARDNYKAFLDKAKQIGQTPEPPKRSPEAQAELDFTKALTTKDTTAAAESFKRMSPDQQKMYQKYHDTLVKETTGQVKGRGSNQTDFEKASAVNDEAGIRAAYDKMSPDEQKSVQGLGIKGVPEPGKAAPVQKVVKTDTSTVSSKEVAPSKGEVTVYNGKGNFRPGGAGNNLLGEGKYYARDKATASEFGKHISETKVKPEEIFTIKDQSQYNKLLAEAAKKYKGDPIANLPKLIGEKGFKAIEANPDVFGKEAGINVIDEKLVKNSDVSASSVKPAPEAKKELPSRFAEKSKQMVLSSGFDPGVDKFIAEDVKPAVERTAEVAQATKGIAKTIKDGIVSFLDQGSAVIRNKALGPKAYSDTIKAFHNADAEILAFDNKKGEVFDKNYAELQKWNESLSKKDKRNLILAVGHPESAEGKVLQEKALSELPPHLKSAEMLKAAREGYDSIYKYAKDNGVNLTYHDDYVYGTYKNGREIERRMRRYYDRQYNASTTRFAKEKVFSTPADAIANGMEYRSENLFTNMKQELQAIAKRVGMKDLAANLKEQKVGFMVDEKKATPYQLKNWEVIHDPVFGDKLFDPTYAKFVNNLLETNQVTQNGFLRALRGTARVAQSVKFFGSAFHMVNMAKASISSEWGGPLNPKGYVDFVKSFKSTDTATPAYKEYVKLGGGPHYSLEHDAATAVSDALDKLGRGNTLGAIVKLPKAILETKVVPGSPGFVKWMFQDYIPTLKFNKFQNDVSAMEHSKGRPLTDAEKIGIIKVNQNFYGEMNERLFGRSATATSLMRLIFTAPGYGEGNYRTLLRSGTGNPRAIAHIVQSLATTAIAASIGTRLMTGQWPDVPKDAKDIRDFFKVKTGIKDTKGKDVYFDLMTYDKDFWGIYGNLLTGQPGKIPTELSARFSGALNPGVQLMAQLGTIVAGNPLQDFKGNPIYDDSDPLNVKILKFMQKSAAGDLQPIPFSTFQQAQGKGLDLKTSAFSALSGLRTTTSEADKDAGIASQKLFTETQKARDDKIAQDKVIEEQIIHGDKSGLKGRDRKSQEAIINQAEIRSVADKLNSAERIVVYMSAAERADYAKKGAAQAATVKKVEAALKNKPRFSR